MSDVVPSSAVVRPRVIAFREDEPQLLEDRIAEIADELSAGLVWLVGGPGSGKSTAIRHLQSIFADDARLVFLDEPSIEEVQRAKEDAIAVASAVTPAGVSGIVLRLRWWGLDDFVEFLHARGCDDCNSILSRIATAKPNVWTPELGRVLADQFAADPRLNDTDGAFLAEIRAHVPQPPHVAAVAEYCLALLSNDALEIKSVADTLHKIDCPQPLVKLLRHTHVQLPLAAAHLATKIFDRSSLRILAKVLPRELISRVAALCSDDARSIERLRGIMNDFGASACQPMAASILRHIDPEWQPASSVAPPLHLAGAYLDGVAWPKALIPHADLTRADFSHADLRNSDLSAANAKSAVFTAANLELACLAGVHAPRADFRGANLGRANLSISECPHASFVGANLSGAALVKADLAAADLSDACLKNADLCAAHLSGARFDNTDFTDAKLDDATLAHADLRTATLDGACFDSAILRHAQLEDVVVHRADWSNARLEYAHLTGSRFPKANLEQVRLNYAHLAEIEWPGADLRGADFAGASFHMGSSRSGHVGSPIACEGSKTGFYTDDREEMYFKRPEEIRKANLCNADLRGANVTNVDFYLVDLRGAKLDSDQIEQARRTGAILDDWQSC